ncbi:MAG: ABC transporter permease [Xanthomonadales bacterium]|nr:ABC transporter permease [Xanthomonadales bacterium]
MAQITWTGYRTIVRKEITRILRIWTQTLVPPAITMTLYFVVFGGLIGSRVGEMGGFDYMQFIVPGLVMMSVITNAYGNVSSSFFSAKFARHVEELLISPLPNWVIVAGYVTAGSFRGLAVGVVVMIVASFFTEFHIAHWPVMLGVLFLTAITFSVAGMINGIFARKFDDVAIIPTFILTPLTYLGGVFYSINLLPEFWRNVSQVNPILHMVNALRYGMLGTSDLNIGIAFAIILGFLVVLLSLCLYLMNRGVGLRS